MTVVDLFHASVRRWYITVLGLVATGSLMLSAQPQTVYWASQVATLESPGSRVTATRQLGQIDRDPIPTAEMLAGLINGSTDLVRSKNSETTLYGEGIYVGSSARIQSTGNQWVTSVPAPDIQVESVASTESSVLERQNREIVLISTTLNALQDRFQVAPSQRMSLTLTPSTPPVHMIRGSRTRAAAAFGLVGLVLTFGLVYMIERAASRIGHERNHSR